MAEDYENFVDKTKITPKVLSRYNKLMAKGTPVKDLVIKLRLEEVDGLITYPQNIIDNNAQDDFDEDIGQFIVEEILPKMGSKTKEVQAASRQYIVGEVDKIFDDLFRTVTDKDKGIPLRGGGKLSINELASTDFTTNMIDIEKLKFRRKSARGNIKKFNIRDAKNQFNGIKASLDSVMKRNFVELFNYLTLKEKNTEEEQDVVFKFIDIPTEELFSNKTMNDLNQRYATYNYWKKISEGFDENFRSNIDRLVGVLTIDIEETAKKELTGDQRLFLQDAQNFVNKMNKIGDLNYIVKTKPKEIKVEDAEERAFLFIERFFKNHHAISEAFDQDNVELIYENVITEEGESKNMSSINVKDTDNPDVDDIDLGVWEKVTLDPLAIKYFKEDLEGLAEFYNDYKSNMLKELRKQFAEYQVFLSKPEDYEAVLEGLEDALESIQMKEIDDEIHLPVFLFNTPTLSRYYKDEASEANAIQEDIFVFLDAYRDLLEDDKTFSAINVNLMLQGEGTTSKIRDPTPFERYKKVEPSKVGSIRKLKKEIKNITDEINNSILELFVKPMHSIHRFGMSLPFEKSVQLRSIVSASDNVSEEFLAYKEIGERLKNFDTNFIEQEDAEDMLNFLQTVTRGDIYDKPIDTQSSARQFVNGIMVAFNGNKKVKEQLKREVSSIYGALISVSKEELDIPNVFKDVNIKDSYVKERIDDPNEIQALQVLTNAIRERQDIMRESNDGPIRDSTLDSLLSELDRVAKSDIYSRLLEAHDALRILKGKSIHYGKRDENNFEHVEDMLIKIQEDYNLDMSASELVSVVNEIDSFNNISKAHGISQEHVYLIKANFR